MPATTPLLYAAKASAHMDEVIGGHYEDGFANESTDGDDGGNVLIGGGHEKTMKDMQAAIPR